MFENEFIQIALRILGVPNQVFSVADPMAVLFMFIFSTRILTFILAIIIWGTIAFFRMYRGGGFKGYQSARDTDEMIHRYHMDDMKKVYKMDKKRSLFSVVILGFIFPVVVIFAALSIAMSMMNV